MLPVELSCLFVKLFERFPVLSLPGDQSVGAPAVYDDRRRRWTGKLRILGEDQEPVFLDERAIANELFALGHDVRIALGRWALIQDGGGAVEYDEAVGGALASRLGSLVAAEEHPSWSRYTSPEFQDPANLASDAAIASPARRA